MTSTPPHTILATAAVLLVSQGETTQAQNCRIHVDSGKCIFITADQRVRPDYSVGEVFPIYEHNMLINLDRYNLPPVDGAWRYYKSGYDIYRVDATDYTVLEIIRNGRLR